MAKPQSVLTDKHGGTKELKFRISNDVAARLDNFRDQLNAKAPNKEFDADKIVERSLAGALDKALRELQKLSSEESAGA